MSVPVLLPRTGSVPVPVTVAEFVTDAYAAGSTSTTTVMTVDSPTPSPDSDRHVTACPTLEHVQPSPAADTNASPVGGVSVTVSRPSSRVGPEFATVSR